MQPHTYNPTLQEQANEYLKSYGYSANSRVRYRIVWAPDETEVRSGDFAIYYGNMYLCTRRDTRRVHKYDYLPECYVLEELIFGQESKELPGSENGTYEPLYTFASAADVPLPLSLKVLDIVMYNKMHRKTAYQIYHDNKTAREQKEIKLAQADIDSLDTNVLLTRLHWGESNFTRGISNVKRANK